MSVKRLFGDATAGNTADKGFVADVMVMGKRTAAIATLAIAGVIGTGVSHGVVSPTEAAVAGNAANFAKGEPPPYVTHDSNVKYDIPYKSNADGLYGNQQIETTGPTGPKMV